MRNSGTYTYLLTANMDTRCGDTNRASTFMQIFTWKMQQKKKDADLPPVSQFCVAHEGNQAAGVFLRAE